MLVFLRITLIIALLIVLIKLKLNLALALLVDAVWAGIIFRLKPLLLLKNFPVTISQTATLEFLLIIYMVLLLGCLMAETGKLRNIINSLENVFRDYRIGLALMPALIGLLPMPAGAMLSAPIVKEIGNKTDLSPEKMTYVNFWFRHVWEYFWPLYPAILISSAIFDVSVRNIMITQFPLTIFAIVVGLYFIIRLPKIKNNKNDVELLQGAKIFYYLWPIILVIILVLLVRLRMSLALTSGVVVALIFSKLSIRRIIFIFKKSFSLSTLGVIYAVFLFKNIMQDSGALSLIPEVASGLPVLQLFIIFLAPFLVGFLTGVNSAFAGIAFPVIAPLMGEPVINLNYIMFAYASGFAGVLLSPVHLCLNLTREYYGAELTKVYKYLVPSVIFIFAGALIILLLRIL